MFGGTTPNLLVSIMHSAPELVVVTLMSEREISEVDGMPCSSLYTASSMAEVSFVLIVFNRDCIFSLCPSSCDMSAPKTIRL